MEKIIYCLVLITALSSCSKEVLTEEVNQNVPVVESYLYPNEEPIVTLSKMLPYTDEEYSESLIIENAEVYIEHNSVDYYLSPIVGQPGKYKSLDTNLKVVSGNVYNLKFLYDENVIKATTTIPFEPNNISISKSTYEIDTNAFGPSIQDPVTVFWDNPDGKYHQVIIEYLETEYKPTNGFLEASTFDEFRKTSSDPILETSYDIRGFMFFGTYQIIVYKVNEEYVNLYENINQSTLNLAEPLTNIENGLGIFTGLSSDTLFVEVVGV